MRLAISQAYASLSSDPPLVVQGRSTRAVAASWADLGGASLQEIFRAVTWSSPLTFVNHYRLGLLADNLGSSVLQSATR